MQQTKALGCFFKTATYSSLGCPHLKEFALGLSITSRTYMKTSGWYWLLCLLTSSHHLSSNMVSRWRQSHPEESNQTYSDHTWALLRRRHTTRWAQLLTKADPKTILDTFQAQTQEIMTMMVHQSHQQVKEIHWRRNNLPTKISFTVFASSMLSSKSVESSDLLAGTSFMSSLMPICILQSQCLRTSSLKTMRSHGKLWSSWLGKSTMEAMWRMILIEHYSCVSSTSSRTRKLSKSLVSPSPRVVPTLFPFMKA